MPQQRSPVVIVPAVPAVDGNAPRDTDPIGRAWREVARQGL
jgi:hypothetical protein